MNQSLCQNDFVVKHWAKHLTLKKHCLFCLEITECKLDNEYDAKTTVQYRIPASMVATTEMCDGKAYIETLMKKCRNRNDVLGSVVYDRLLAAGGDLAATEARYHRKCSCLSINILKAMVIFHIPKLTQLC